MPAKKLTPGIINDRLAPRGIVMVGEYVNTRTKIAFKCAEGHTWDAKPNDIMNGKGCPHCSGRIVTKDIVNGRIADRGIVMIGEYVGSQTKTTFQCAEKHTWDAAPSSVMSRNGCPHCAGNARLTVESINKKIADRGIIMIGKLDNAITKTTFKCAEGHTWDAKPDSVIRGNGCPQCATTRGDNDTIYIWKAVDCYHHGKQVYKIGITSARRGDARIRECANAQGIEAEILVLAYVNGNATDIETRLLQLGDDPRYQGDGSTEFRALSDMDLRRAMDVIAAAEIKHQAAA